MKRIEFVKQIGVLTFLGMPLLTTSACSPEVTPASPPNTDPKDCLANGTSSSISNNHGHIISVSKADVKDGAEKAYSIDGSANHDHTVVITADNFEALKTNQSIQVPSSTSAGHAHTITVTCA
jgi:hypothetical protein